MMALLPKEVRTQLRAGVSDAVVDLRVKDNDMGWIREVVIELVFARGTPIDVVIADRDRARANYTNTMQRLGSDTAIPELYFVLDEEPVASTVPSDESLPQPPLPAMTSIRRAYFPNRSLAALTLVAGVATVTLAPASAGAQVVPSAVEASGHTVKRPAGPPRHALWVGAAYASNTPDLRDDFVKAALPIWSTAYANYHEYNKTIPDDREYGLEATYRYRLSDRLTAGGGLAVARLSQGFASRSDLQYWYPGELVPDPLISRFDYRAYLAQVTPEVAFAVLRRERAAAGVSLSARYSMTFRKTANSYHGLDFDGPALRVNVREPFATEVYPGAYAAAGPARLDVQYRALHRKYRDDSALNNGLRVDPYNPAKWRLALSYRVARWGRGKQAPASEKMDKT